MSHVLVRRRLFPGSPRTLPGDDVLRPASVDELLDRTLRWPTAAALLFRLLTAAGPLSVAVETHGADALRPLLAGAAMLLAANLAVLVRVLVAGELDRPRLRRWLAADIALAFAGNLWAAAVVPGRVDDPYQDVLWFYLMGTVLLCTGWFGPAAGTVLAVAGVPLQLGMSALDDSPLPPSPGAVLGRTVWLGVGVVAASLILGLVRMSARVALGAGVRAGRQAEQLSTMRALHDTVLQTLEGIVLLGANRAVAADERLDQVVSAARSQAVELRAELDALAGTATRPGAGEAGDVDEEFASMVRRSASDLSQLGVELQLRPGRSVGLGVPRRHGDAIRLAVREALANVGRHAQASHTVVRVASLPDRLEVLVRDDGHGFDPERGPGFGITHSIKGRLTDVGGGATVASSPDRGTVVRMWVPR